MNYKEYINHLKTKACINVEPTHRCLLQCVFCTRQNPWEGKDKVKQARMSYGDLELNHSKMIGDYFSSITMCGNISDIIYHPNLISIIKEIGKTSLNYFEFRTNGAGKSLDWWKEIVEACNENTKQDKRWIFGIDGIDDKCAIHRVNQNFQSAFDGMKYVSENLISGQQDKVTWQYIPFSYNEHEIPTAFKMSQEIGVTFMLLKSPRFNQLPGRIEIEPPLNPNLISPSGFNNETYIRNEYELTRFLYANENKT
jgi:hypothetical protein